MIKVPKEMRRSVPEPESVGEGDATLWSVEHVAVLLAGVGMILKDVISYEDSFLMMGRAEVKPLNEDAGGRVEDTGDDGEPVKRVSEEVFVIEDQKHVVAARIARSQCMGNRDNWMASSIPVVFQDVLKCGSSLSIHSTQSILTHKEKFQDLVHHIRVELLRAESCYVVLVVTGFEGFERITDSKFVRDVKYFKCWNEIGFDGVIGVTVGWNGMLECLSRNESLEARMEWIRLDGMLGWNESLTSPNKGKLVTKNFIGLLIGMDVIIGRLT
ncbi:hypothetical protein FNV43_RR19618 [Rhamnella rubrinervis]|uniref:Uncharacterized protein n=1 Tax=Rhamnella rubrinervis TaxID=2594499 RepID=A0A8K0DTC3_9ROSA|nr:hypothetical protein FNV43_RR19618 [Rhamnella rubrinervis]